MSAARITELITLRMSALEDSAKGVETGLDGQPIGKYIEKLEEELAPLQLIWPQPHWEF